MVSGKISGDPLAITAVGLNMAAIQAGANVQAPYTLFAATQFNLADLSNPSTALTNLGGLSAALASTTYLTQVDAASTYLTIANAAATYLTTAAAALAYQPLDSDLTSWAGVTRAAGFDTFAATPSSANLKTLVTDETGSGALVFATSPALVTPALGTPASGVLTNATGLPISTGVSGLGAGVATFLATPSSANLATAVTGETGTGALVFGTAPTIANPAITGITGTMGAAATNFGMELVGYPALNKTFAGQSDYFGFYANVTANNSTSAEVAAHFGITSATGATPNPTTAYKMALAATTTVNSGSGSGWGINPVINIGAGGSQRGGIGLEVNVNNDWGNYTGSPSNPYCVGIHIAGTNTGGYGSAAIGIEHGFGTAGNAMWNAGIHFGVAGFKHFNTASIWDETDSPIILKVSGSHTSGIEMASATFSGNAWASPGITIGTAGALVGTLATQSTSVSTGAFITAGGLGVAKDIFGGGKISALATSGFYLGANAALFQSGNYTFLFDSGASGFLQAGNASDPTNYYGNDTHAIRNRAGSVTFATINATGLGIGAAPANAFLSVAAGTTALAQLYLPVSAAPSSPVDGQIWRQDNTNTGLKVRIAGVTKSITVA